MINAEIMKTLFFMILTALIMIAFQASLDPLSGWRHSLFADYPKQFLKGWLWKLQYKDFTAITKTYPYKTLCKLPVAKVEIQDPINRYPIMIFKVDKQTTKKLFQ